MSAFIHNVHGVKFEVLTMADVKMMYSGLWLCVVWYVFNISVELSASTFRAENLPWRETQQVPLKHS
jgi:hypothetical protein